MNRGVLNTRTSIILSTPEHMGDIAFHKFLEQNKVIILLNAFCSLY